MGCYPAVEKAGWWLIDNGNPKKQFTLTTVGIDIAGEGMVTKYNDCDNAIFHDGIVHIIAKCVPSNKEMDMWDDFSDVKPTLICKKGEGVAIRFMSPNSKNPEDYVYHATLTVKVDDETAINRPSSVRSKIAVKLPATHKLPRPSSPSHLEGYISKNFGSSSRF
jgi:hypothetical protein